MTYSSLKKNNVTVLDNDSTKQTIVFAHGFGTDQTAWKNVSDAFADKYRLVLYDNVGAGNADPSAFSPNKYDTLHSYADDLLDICNDLQVKDAIMVGHSVSGMISLPTVSIQASAALISRLVALSAIARMPTMAMADSAWMNAARNDSMIPRFTVRSFAST